MNESQIFSIIFFYGTIALIWYFVRLNKRNKEMEREEQLSKSKEQYHNKIEEPIVINNQWENCYEPVYFMTQNEKAQFRKIMNWAQKNHLYVFAKVRLADLIKPRGNNQKLFWKIQAKHVDFVICDGNLKIKLIIELQDRSHNDPKRKERDDFMKEVLESCGYKTLWVYNISDEILNKALGIVEKSESEKPTENN